MEMALRVSIVIPTRNRHAAVRECVEACLAQDYPQGCFEILVIDDGSEPPVPGFEDARVRVVRQHAAGPAAARNHGIRAACGVWIAFTDDDCRPHPDWLAHLEKAWREAPSCLIGGHTINALHGNVYTAASQFLIDYLYLYFHTRPRQRFFTSNNLAAARDGLAAVTGFDERFIMAAAEDLDLCERWRENGGSLLYIPEAVVEHYHALSFSKYLRQHFRYGCGAAVLHRKRAELGFKVPPEPRTFYFGTIAAAFRSGQPGNSLRLFGLLLLAHTANLMGFVCTWSRAREVQNASGQIFNDE